MNGIAPFDPLQDTWPKLDGYIIGLKFIPPNRLKAHLREWKIWMAEHPKKDWPFHLTDFIDDMKRQGKKIDP